MVLSCLFYQLVGQDEAMDIWKYERYGNLIIGWEAKPCDPLSHISFKGPHCINPFSIHSIWEYWPYRICSINIPILRAYIHQVSKLFLFSKLLEIHFPLSIFWVTKFETHGHPISEDYPCKADPEAHSSISRVYKCA